MKADSNCIKSQVCWARTKSWHTCQYQRRIPLRFSFFYVRKYPRFRRVGKFWPSSIHHLYPEAHATQSVFPESRQSRQRPKFNRAAKDIRASTAQRFEKHMRHDIIAMHKSLFADKTWPSRSPWEMWLKTTLKVGFKELFLNEINKQTCNWTFKFRIQIF